LTELPLSSLFLYLLSDFFSRELDQSLLSHEAQIGTRTAGAAAACSRARSHSTRPKLASPPGLSAPEVTIPGRRAWPKVLDEWQLGADVCDPATSTSMEPDLGGPGGVARRGI
jgi:hypothetical protein